MNNRHIAQRRMHSQRLWGSPFDTPEDVVHALGALQSQEYLLAKWSVAQRTHDVDDAGMDQAFADGVILRTHVLRPTWHFVLPADIRWMLALTAPRVNALNAHYHRKLGLDDEIFTKCNALLGKALAGGRQLTRKELAAVLERAGIAAGGPYLGFIMMRAELDAVICSGALRGKQHTYALLEERAPQVKSLDRDEALAELTRRYFTARGPATLKDFSWWSSLTAADARNGIDMVKSQLEHEVVDGRTYWFAEPSPRRQTTTEVIDIVQGYDECIVSYGESKDVLHESASSSTWGTGGFTHAILLDGRLVGHWRRVREQNSIIVETSFYRSLDRGEARALKEAVDRYGRFMGLPTTLS